MRIILPSEIALAGKYFLRSSCRLTRAPTRIFNRNLVLQLQIANFGGSRGLQLPEKARIRWAFRPGLVEEVRLELTYFLIPNQGPSPLIWWSLPGSNRRLPACKAGALPTELRPHIGLRSFGGARGNRTLGLSRAKGALSQAELQPHKLFFSQPLHFPTFHHLPLQVLPVWSWLGSIELPAY